MKKIISLFIMLVLVVSAFSLSAFAAETEATDGDVANITLVGSEGYKIYRDWEENGYPDDIGAVIVSSDGYDPSSGVTTLYNRYIIYVVKGTSSDRKAELQEMMGSPYVTFRECTISKNTQNAYVASLRERLGELVYEIVPTANKDDLLITLYYPDENNDEIKSIIESEFPYILSYCELRAGVNPIDLNAALETGLSTYYNYDHNSTDTIGAALQSPILFITIALVVVLTGALFFVLRRKNVAQGAETLALTNGDTETVSTTLTKKEAEREVSESTLTPSDKVFDEIMKKL